MKIMRIKDESDERDDGDILINCLENFEVQNWNGN